MQILTGFRLLTLALLAAAATLMAEELAAPDATEFASCPAMQDGSCPHNGHAMPGHGGMSMFERMGSELALSDSQKQELATLLEMYRPRIKQLWERGEASQQALFDIAPDDPAYNIRAAELSQLAGASAAEMVTLMTELQSNAYALLTTEQQAKFLALRAEQRARMEAMRNKMQERRASGEWQPGMDGMHHMHRMHKNSCEDCPAAN